MEATFWYFTFKIKDPATGFAKEDKAVTSSIDSLFPIALIEEWAEEEFGKTAELLISNIVEISLESYERLSAKMGVE